MQTRVVRPCLVLQQHMLVEDKGLPRFGRTETCLEKALVVVKSGQQGEFGILQITKIEESKAQNVSFVAFNVLSDKTHFDICSD